MQMELRKLDRDYRRCMAADLSKKMEEFDKSTPLIDQLRAKAKKSQEIKK